MKEYRKFGSVNFQTCEAMQFIYGGADSTVDKLTEFVAPDKIMFRMERHPGAIASATVAGDGGVHTVFHDTNWVVKVTPDSFEIYSNADFIRNFKPVDRNFKPVETVA